jgi:hypothetical protein
MIAGEIGFPLVNLVFLLVEYSHVYDVFDTGELAKITKTSSWQFANIYLILSYLILSIDLSTYLSNLSIYLILSYLVVSNDIYICYQPRSHGSKGERW